MSKKTILIDLDDTLNSLVPKWLELYNKDFGDNLKQENILSWNIVDYVKPEAKKVFFDYILQDGFFQQLDIQPYAYETTKWLSNYFNIYIVTAYHPKTCWDKAQWVTKNLPHINNHNIIFCNHKGLIKGDYLIDDGLHNVLEFKNTNTFGLPLVFDKPWNQHLENKFIRVKDWLEIREWFEEWLCNKI